MDLSDPKLMLARFGAPVIVRFCVIFSTPSMDREFWPLLVEPTATSVAMATEPLYVVQDAKAAASPVAVIVKVAELLH